MGTPVWEIFHPMYTPPRARRTSSSPCFSSQSSSFASSDISSALQLPTLRTCTDLNNQKKKRPPLLLRRSQRRRLMIRNQRSLNQKKKLPELKPELKMVQHEIDLHLNLKKKYELNQPFIRLAEMQILFSWAHLEHEYKFNS